MYKEERRQKSFYDAVYEAGVPEGHFLRRLEELIDWRGLKKYLHKHYFKKGRPAHNPIRDRCKTPWFFYSSYLTLNPYHKISIFVKSQ